MVKSSRGFVLVALVCIFVSACSGAVVQVSTSQNSYAYLIDRYKTSCPEGSVAHDTEPCPTIKKKLNQYEHDLHLANAAVGNGGKLPRQLAAIKADEKAITEIK